MVLAAFFAVLVVPAAAHADDAMTAAVDQKINKVLANQERILTELDEIKKELEIVKVRATLAGA
jgi:hypothetical protein